MKAIFENFPVTETEYSELDEKFGNLAHYAAWQLVKKNLNNNYTDDVDDISQELKLSMIRAGSYYKRQVYIEACFRHVKDCVKGGFTSAIVDELEDLWINRTRHGANRQKFGPFQEILLDILVKEVVPLDMRPSKKQKLKIDTKFTTYCKAIAWNTQKSMGKKITKEKSIRSGQVSLSEFSYLGAGDGL
jgi:hypothetical protein